MRKHSEIKPDTIEKITLEGTRNLRHRRRFEVDNIMNAMMSIRYVGAVTVFDGQCLPDQFTDEKIKDPRIQELFDRIDVVENPEFENMPELSRWHTVVHIKLKDGRTFEEEVSHPKGTPENPMTMEETYAKFRYMTSKGVGKDEAEDILNIVGKLDRLKDISKLGELLA
jgi:2-methylcitrate dehydratase PrpD